jgi:hypothetical protein
MIETLLKLFGLPFWLLVTKAVLIGFPTDVPVTLTANVHDVKGISVAPAKLTELEPATAVMVPPKQLPVRPLGVATTSPDGRASVTVTPVKVVPKLKLESVKVSVVLPPTAIEGAPNAMLGIFRRRRTR